MKLNATPRHYMPLSQNQSDDDESGPCKEEKVENIDTSGSFDTSEVLSNRIRESIAEEVDLKKLPMSPIRIIMFILSLIMCILFVIIFVFFMPCMPPGNLNSTCHLSSRWSKVFHNMSFSKLLCVVKNDLLEDNFVIVGYTSENSGLLALQTQDGNLQWQLPVHSTPFSCMCDAIDVNGDGIPECLIVGDNGLLTAIDIKKGASLWYLHNHSDLSSASSISIPTLLPDCNGDNIPDLVISYNLPNVKNTSFLVLVSGGTGRIIGPLFDLPHCTGPVLFQLAWDWRNKTDFIFYCAEEKNGNMWIVSSEEICKKSLNKTNTLELKNLYRIPHFRKDVQFYKIRNVKYQFMIVLDGVELISLVRSTQYNFKTLWKISLDQQFRIVSDGHFMEDSNQQIVIVNSNTSHSMVSGLNIIDGNEVWSFSAENQTIVSVMKLPMFFGSVDGLLLNTLAEPSFFGKENIELSSGDSWEDPKILIKHSNAVENNHMTIVEENYILLKSGSTPVLKTLDNEQILLFCKDHTCKPDVFVTNSIALTDVSEGSELGLLIVSNTFTTNTTTNAEEEMNVKLFHLERLMNVSNCY